MTQFVLPWPVHAARGRADFFVSGSNRAALGWIERWPDWPAHALVLYGPPGSGKTHLAHVWRERCGGAPFDPATAGDAVGTQARGIVADDAQAVSERALLHLYNWTAERGTTLLVVARTAPSIWPIALADLASRLRAAPSVAIEPPDDTLLGAVLVKHFADRQLRAGPELIDYLVRRMERSFAAAAALVGRLDAAAMATRRPIGVALAREILGESEV